MTLLEQENKDGSQKEKKEEIELEININLEEVVENTSHLIGKPILTAIYLKIV